MNAINSGEMSGIMGAGSTGGRTGGLTEAGLLSTEWSLKPTGVSRLPVELERSF